jgi:hypothetical protein
VTGVGETTKRRLAIVVEALEGTKRRLLVVVERVDVAKWRLVVIVEVETVHAAKGRLTADLPPIKHKEVRNRANTTETSVVARNY